MPPFLCAVYQSRYTLTVERFSILIYHSISHLFTLAAGHEMKKKYEQDLGRLLHRCLTQVVPRCSDGFIGNRIAKLILKKKNHRRQTDPISNLAEKMSTGRRALWSGRPMVHLLWGAASIWRCGKWKLEFSWIYSSQYILYRVARYEDDLWLW